MTMTIAANSRITAGIEPADDGLADELGRAASDNNHPLSPAYERGSGNESLVDATYRHGWMCGPWPHHLRPAE
jgi:hypothetical protein